MKIKIKVKSYDEVIALKRPKHVLPKRPSRFFQTLVRIVSQFELWKTNFKYTGKLDKKKGPYLVLMNHSSFIDLKIAFKILFPMPFHIVCTHDALVGKKWLMKNIGCIPTRKFVSDITLINDMRHALKHKRSVLLYPEAGYSFDGKATALPDNFGRLVKMLGVSVAFIETRGAFLRDPLYNGLKLRRVPVSAHIETLFTADKIKDLSVDEINNKINTAFSFDNFAWQRDNAVSVNEPFRADGLERILYKCANCLSEGEMHGNGTKITCNHCGKSYTLNEFGELEADDGNTEFSHIPDWYAWQRQKVREELVSGKYQLNIPVDIIVMLDYKALYKVGNGTLTHNLDGFKLVGCDGKLNYSQPPLSSYGLNADYFWYEIGDVIGIGDSNALYYCFPPKGVSVAKARLATEELYKLYKSKSIDYVKEKLIKNKFITV